MAGLEIGSPEVVDQKPSATIIKGAAAAAAAASTTGEPQQQPPKQLQPQPAQLKFYVSGGESAANIPVAVLEIDYKEKLFKL